MKTFWIINRVPVQPHHHTLAAVHYMFTSRPSARRLPCISAHHAWICGIVTVPFGGAGLWFECLFQVPMFIPNHKTNTGILTEQLSSRTWEMHGHETWRPGSRRRNQFLHMEDRKEALFLRWGGLRWRESWWGLRVGLLWTTGLFKPLKVWQKINFLCFHSLKKSSGDLMVVNCHNRVNIWSEHGRNSVLPPLTSFLSPSFPLDGQTGQWQPDREVPGVAAFQLFWWRRAGWQPPIHRHFGGEALCDCGGCGEADRDLHEEFRALQEAHQRVSPSSTVQLESHIIRVLSRSSSRQEKLVLIDSMLNHGCGRET